MSKTKSYRMYIIDIIIYSLKIFKIKYILLHIVLVKQLLIFLASIILMVSRRKNCTPSKWLRCVYLIHVPGTVHDLTYFQDYLKTCDVKTKELQRFNLFFIIKKKDFLKEKPNE